MMEQVPKKPRIVVWISAFRVHTLPLAIASIILGTFLSYKVHFNLVIALLTLLRAILLQILSNLANDYGDTKHGADTEKRVGPERMVHSGQISIGAIKGGIVVTIILSFLSGLFLLLFSLQNIGYVGAMVLFLIGLAAIGAAVGYTASKKPYGYRGMGDISVFFFFGIVGVTGSYYLQTGYFPVQILLPAIAMGLLCAAVLNINNIRDIESDSVANKRTVAVRLGLRKAKIYHWLLLLIPIILFTAYALLTWNNHWWLALVPGFLLVINGSGVSKSKNPEDIVPFLKELVMSVLVYAIYLSLCSVLF